ncbi:MAG TPA: ATP-binding protein [Hyphomicrobiaceae bacterium]|jgi:signal transduction histidine kinase|nr:ATP-binding protein [Hyphomicrobiaceae bacterium]
MRRIYHQFYLTILASLLAVVVMAGALWRFAPTETPSDQAFEMAGVLVATQLAPAGAPLAAQQQAIEQLYARLGLDIGLFDAERRPLAAVGDPVPPPGARQSGGWVYGRYGPAWAIRLPDGRWVVARPPPRQRRPVLGIVAFLAAIALLVAICAYPLVRRLTRRLERLQAGVESLGAGDLAARVKVEGKDEVASLAASFNRAAQRIEELVGAHKMLLAHTSHELRTPLARIRLGIELLQSDPDAKRKANLERDIAELDALIEQILLSSRLGAVSAVDRSEEVDLLAVAAEEAARYADCSVAGEPVVVRGDRGLLQRMVRNLLDNAQQHGVAPIAVNVSAAKDAATLLVCDHGPGIAPEDRERIFSPFYRAAAASGAAGTGLGLTLVRQIARQHGGDASWTLTPSGLNAIRVVIARAPG